LRPFRPSALTLEAICPVSSLATAMPPSASPAVGESGTTAVRLDQPTRHTLAASSVAGSPRIAPNPITLARPVANGPVVATIATPGQQAAVPTIPVDLSRYANSITIAAANAPPAHSSSGAAPVSKPGGGSVAPPSQATAPPAIAPTSTVAMPAPVIMPASPDGTAPAPTSSAGIRPMTMTATTKSAASTSPTVTMMASGIDPNAPPPDLPPMLVVSGGNWGGGTQLTINEFQDQNPVPLGVTVRIVAQDPTPAYHVLSITSCVGGTSIAGYFKDDAGTASPPSMKIQTNIQAGQSDDNFVTDSKPRGYTIVVDVAYANGAKGESTIYFTTDGPTASLRPISQGSPHFNPSTIDMNNLDASGHPTPIAQVVYDNPPGGPYPKNAGMRLQAIVTPSVNFGGTLMFLQTMTTQRLATFVPSGTPVSQIYSINGKMAQDNGIFTSYGYPLDTSTFTKPPIYNRDWPVDRGPAIPQVMQSMSDTPDITGPLSANPISLQVGLSGAAEMFSAYLMYRYDTSSVWVPIAQSNWQWSMRADRPTPTDPWVEGAPSAPAPTPVNPPAFGPEWDTRFSDGRWR